jgi:2-methylisocitrate lyase-like PEP mutase family enzyme
MIKQGINQLSAKEKRQRLRQCFKKGHLVTAPGVFEMISAKFADELEFEALYMTGYGTVASHLGLPDAGLATYSDMVNRVSQFCQITQTPLICDGDTGYGGLLNVMHTVRGYENAGAAAIQLEDQEFPKKCGHMLGRKVVPKQDMVDKIRVAVETRDDPNFLIIARTDARTTLGLSEAMHRMEAYAKAGADLLFIESPESIEEMRLIGQAFDLPLVANMVEGGRTPILSAKELTDIGYGLAIFPATAFLAASQAFKGVYDSIKEHLSSDQLSVPIYPFKELSAKMGFDWVADFDQRFSDGHGSK